VDRLIGTAVLLLVAIVVLPAVARLAQAAVPALVSVIFLLALVRLALPPSRRRR